MLTPQTNRTKQMAVTAFICTASRLFFNYTNTHKKVNNFDGGPLGDWISMH
jgi:hypothetical protein